MALADLISFLEAYHARVMGYEQEALRALEQGQTDTYTQCMQNKAQAMAGILEACSPFLKDLDAQTSDAIYHPLHRFSNSARLGLRLNSPFYWSALLWNDDAKPGDKDNLLLFIESLKAR